MTNEQLVELIKNGENVAENTLQLWKQNKNLIGKMAMKYRGYAEIDDLTQEGFIGLCNAADHYEPNKEVLFSTYATFWIKQAMCRYIFNCTSAIRLPKYAQSEVQQYRKIKADYKKVYGIEPTDEEIRGLLGVSLRKYEDIKKNDYISYLHSFSEPIAGDKEILLGDSLASDQNLEEEVSKNADTAAISLELWQAVDNLSNDMASVINMRYKDGLTVKEVAEYDGFTQGKVRRTEEKALITLSRNNSLAEYYNQYLSLRHVGVREFNRTWTSSVEGAVLGW